MNILYIAPYHHPANDGWGQAAKEYGQALLATSHDITMRPITMVNGALEIPMEFYEHQDKLDHYDICIQNVLPHMLEYNGNFRKNIALVHIETGRLQNTIWPSKLNTMDAIIVPSRYSETCLLRSGVTTPIYVIPVPTDVNKYNTDIPLLDLPTDDFLFYTVGSFIERKNYSNLLKAFHLEFDPWEPVSFLIKTSGNGDDIQRFCGQVRKELGIRPDGEYKPEIIVLDYLSDQQMASLHKSCDCFINASCGESWCLPLVDAMGFQSGVITSETGCCHLIEPVLWINQIPPVYEPVSVINRPLPDLYTGAEVWQRPPILRLQQLMRAHYNKQNENLKQLHYQRVMEQLTYDRVAAKLNEACQ